jgi:hypothetical protein
MSSGISSPAGERGVKSFETHDYLLKILDKSAFFLTHSTLQAYNP